MDDTPEQRYQRLSSVVQETILKNFPNPERKGCPEDGVVREVARRRELIEDESWQHITHCSPCYATFLKYKDQFRLSRRRRGLGFILGAAFLIILGLSVTVFELNRRGGNAPVVNRYIAATLDLSDRSTTRGTKTTAHTPAPLSLPHQALDLTIYLPFGSEAGKYEVRLQHGTRALMTAQGIAQIANGRTDLHVKLDLSKYSSGNYLIGMRQPPWNWNDYPVSVR